MVFDFIGYFFAGGALSLSVCSPLEWMVHKNILHAPSSLRKKVKFIENASRGHNDIHHRAYNGPAHYYRDITNENQVIHFAKGDVGLIAGAAAIVGGAIDGVFLSLNENAYFGIGDALFLSGFVGGTMAYYGGYEFVHHFMHVIGERRLTVNRVIGDKIQGGTENRDGNLRLSKPLLDDICNLIERDIDSNFNRQFRSNFLYPYSLVQRFAEQIRYNTERKAIKKLPLAYVDVHSEDVEKLLSATRDVLLEREINYREDLATFKERIYYGTNRTIQRYLRNSKVFRSLDNHHFLHHCRYHNNLNVLFPLMDNIMQTKLDSSIKVLEENKNFWLCPNSPDISPFKAREAFA